MPRFFLEKSALSGEFATITGDDAFHISHSLRMRKNEMLVICDLEGTDYLCEIEDFTKNEVSVRILERRPSESESPAFITLYQGIPKGDKMGDIIQKAVECGVSRIVPVVMQNCVAKINDDAENKKIARWQRIADEAAKQSQRSRRVEIRAPVSYKYAVESAAKDGLSFLCYENEKGHTLGVLLSGERHKTISFIIGPEGGISASEAEYAEKNGVESVTLGKRILRTETASLFVLSAISTIYELL